MVFGIERCFCWQLRPTFRTPIFLDRSLSGDCVTWRGRKRGQGGLRANCENWEDSTRIMLNIPHPCLGRWVDVRNFRTITFSFQATHSLGHLSGIKSSILGWCVVTKIRTQFSHKLNTNLRGNYAVDKSKLRLQVVMDIRGPISAAQAPICTMPRCNAQKIHYKANYTLMG